MNVLRERVRLVHPVYVGLLRGYFDAEAKSGRLRHVDAEMLAHAFFGGIREYVLAEIFAFIAVLILAPGQFLMRYFGSRYSRLSLP